MRAYLVEVGVALFHLHRVIYLVSVEKSWTKGVTEVVNVSVLFLVFVLISIAHYGEFITECVLYKEIIFMLAQTAADVALAPAMFLSPLLLPLALCVLLNFFNPPAPIPQAPIVHRQLALYPFSTSR